MANKGRPTDFKEEYIEKVYKLALLGATDKELADFFEVKEQTINNWKNKHPDFFESIKKGKEDADANVAESLYKKALKGDVTASIFWLKNRRSNHWRDKQEIKQDIDATVKVETVRDVDTIKNL